ncbi:hypothetical protein BpHYR1_000092 [Brachionus plicatilis]|uniref:Uncharacterized protein n=1 Tax=Brachionus plicatilis TaxID=10195 RepID=A0A3M7PND0_BRAPC|nr:hypothetical protein BpHYR1_000092 [Brachionus plicatilis]
MLRFLQLKIRYQCSILQQSVDNFLRQNVPQYGTLPLLSIPTKFSQESSLAFARNLDEDMFSSNM